MKYLFLTIFFLASFAVIACGQIVFPSPNQVEMQKGYLTLRKKISIYAEDTTTFYLSLFRTEVLHNASVKWTKKASKAEIRWMTDSSLPPDGYVSFAGIFDNFLYLFLCIKSLLFFSFSYRASYLCKTRILFDFDSPT